MKRKEIERLSGIRFGGKQTPHSRIIKQAKYEPTPKSTLPFYAWFSA